MPGNGSRSGNGRLRRSDNTDRRRQRSMPLRLYWTVRSRYCIIIHHSTILFVYTVISLKLHAYYIIIRKYIFVLRFIFNFKIHSSWEWCDPQVWQMLELQVHVHVRFLIFRIWETHYYAFKKTKNIVISSETDCGSSPIIPAERSLTRSPSAVERATQRELRQHKVYKCNQ